MIRYLTLLLALIASPALAGPDRPLKPGTVITKATNLTSYRYIDALPATSPDRVAPHRTGANGLGPLPAFSAAEVLMHANDEEGSVELIDVDLALPAASAVHR